MLFSVCISIIIHISNQHLLVLLASFWNLIFYLQRFAESLFGNPGVDCAKSLWFGAPSATLSHRPLHWSFSQIITQSSPVFTDCAPSPPRAFRSWQGFMVQLIMFIANELPGVDEITKWFYYLYLWIQDNSHVQRIGLHCNSWFLHW